MNGDCGVSGSVLVDGIIDNINGGFPPSLPDNNVALIYTNCDNTLTTGELVLSSINRFSSLRFDFNSLVSTSVISDERISLNGDLDVNLFETDIVIENLAVDINLECNARTGIFALH